MKVLFTPAFTLFILLGSSDSTEAARTNCRALISSVVLGVGSLCLNTGCQSQVSKDFDRFQMVTPQEKQVFITKLQSLGFSEQNPLAIEFLPDTHPNGTRISAAEMLNLEGVENEILGSKGRVEPLPPWKEAIARHQFEIFQMVLHQKNKPIFLEGITKDLDSSSHSLLDELRDDLKKWMASDPMPQSFRAALDQDLMDTSINRNIVSRIFANGVPTNYNDLSLKQRLVFSEIQGPIIAWSLKLVPTIYAADDAKILVEISSNIKYSETSGRLSVRTSESSDTFTKIFDLREKAALTKIAETSRNLGATDITLIFGNLHKFEDYSNSVAIIRRRTILPPQTDPSSSP